MMSKILLKLKGFGLWLRNILPKTFFMTLFIASVIGNAYQYNLYVILKPRLEKLEAMTDSNYYRTLKNDKLASYAIGLANDNAQTLMKFRAKGAIEVKISEQQD